MNKREVENCWIGFCAWFAEHELETIETEFRLWADDWCGQVDWVGWFDGEIYVIDWKTSKSLYHKDRIQVAGYRKELQKQLDEDFVNKKPEWGPYSCKEMQIEGHGVLRLDKETGGFEWRDYSKFYEKDVEEFQLIRNLYMIRHPIIAKQFVVKKEYGHLEIIKED